MVKSTLIASSLSGCSKKDEKTYSLKSTVEALHKKDNLTITDEYLLENKINDLDKELIEAYNSQDKYKCNEIIGEISYIILKSLIAEGYNIDYNKIKNFNIIGNFLEGYNDWSGKHNTITEYGVEFEYEGINYKFEAEEFARKICIIYRASKANQLVNEDEYSDFNYFHIPQAYKELANSLETIVKSRNEEHTNKFDQEVGENFDGFFSLEENKEKKNTIKKYKKEKIVLSLNNKSNKLPNK